MLKGYVERVFSEGFAYQISEDGEIENLLRHKKVSLSTPTMHRGLFLIPIRFPPPPIT